jgi:hypothetical protein
VCLAALSKKYATSERAGQARGPQRGSPAGMEVRLPDHETPELAFLSRAVPGARNVAQKEELGEFLTGAAITFFLFRSLYTLRTNARR